MIKPNARQNTNTCKRKWIGVNEYDYGNYCEGNSARGAQPITLGKIVTEWVSPKLFIIVHDY